MAWALPPSVRRAKAVQMLDRVGLPARYADSSPGQLSGGQRQRRNCQALVMNPKSSFATNQPGS